MRIQICGFHLQPIPVTNQIIKDNLEVFKSQYGVQNWIVDRKLAESSYPNEIRALKRDLDLRREGKSVAPSELEKLNKHLINRVSEKEILDKLDDIRRHPSEYHDLFENLMRLAFDDQSSTKQS